MKEDAQRLLSIDPPRRGTPAAARAGAERDRLLHRQRPEALGRSWALEAEGDRKAVELQDRAALATIAGDFTSAEHRLGEWQRRRRRQARPGRPRDPRAAPRRAVHRGRAAPEGERRRRRLPAPDERLDRARDGELDDALPRLPAPGRRRLHAPTTSGAARRPSRRSAPSGRAPDASSTTTIAWVAWSLGLRRRGRHRGRSARRRRRHAQGAIRRHGERPLADRRPRHGAGLRALGLVRAGPRARCAAAASPCLALADPLPRTWAQFYLGMALEGTGDVEGARAAYRTVVERWGKATPRSVTAEKARKRLLALGDKKN